MLAAAVASAHRDVLTSETATGSGVLDGRTSDGGLGGSGRPWAQNAAGFGYSIVTGRVQRQATGEVRRCVLDVGTPDVVMRWLVAVAPSGGNVFLVVRAGGTSTGGDHLRVMISSTAATLQRVSGGSATNLASPVTITAPVAVTLLALGPRIAMLAGSTLREVTDSAVLTGSRCGLQCSSSGQGFELVDMTIEAA